MQFIPRPVVAGFLSGIGLTILCTQLSVILGYDVSHNEEGGAIGLLLETVRQVRLTDPRSLAVGLTAIVVMLGLPRLTRKLPTPLIAVGLASLLPMVFGWTSVSLLGELPRVVPGAGAAGDPLVRVERGGHGGHDHLPAGVDRVAAVGLGRRLDGEADVAWTTIRNWSARGWATSPRRCSGASR